MAGIVFRVDKKAFSQDIANISVFCDKCDPNGKGGGPGVLGRLLKCNQLRPSNDIIMGYDVQEFAKYHCFCPTCGEKLDYSTRLVRENYLK